jgi:ribosome maturation factor RimP
LTEADYDRFQGRLVKLKLRRDGRHIVQRGRLVRTPSGRLALETAEGLLEFTFAEVVSGRLLLDEI